MMFLKAVLIILCILIYWKFFYYHHRNGKTAQFYLLIPAVIAVLTGAYFFCTGIIIPRSIYILYSIIFIYNTLAFVNIYFALKKHRLSSGVDYSLNWIKRTLGQFFVYVAVVISYPCLFLMAIGTYGLLGDEHIYLWIMVILAWTASGIRLLRNHTLK